MVECLPSLQEVPGSMPSTTEEKKKVQVLEYLMEATMCQVPYLNLRKTNKAQYLLSQSLEFNGTKSQLNIQTSHFKYHDPIDKLSQWCQIERKIPKSKDLEEEQKLAR